MRIASPLALSLACLLVTSPVRDAAAQEGWVLAQSDNRYATGAPPIGGQLQTPSTSDARYSSAARGPGVRGGGVQTPSALGDGIAPIGSPPRPQGFQRPTPPAATVGPSAPVGRSAPSRVTVTKGPASLPNDQGQVWRNYDIRPYTLRSQPGEKPEQRVVDWILRETGYEAWHSQPVGLLSASRETLSVYHTEAMQGMVAGILDRFVNAQAASKAFSLRIATVRNPNWRAKALTLMTPIPVQSPGMQGWIMPKENAAILLSELTRRSDWREHSASNQIVMNGRSAMLSTMRPRTYIKGVIRTENAWPGFQPETGQLEEGATMEFSPLLSLDQSTADAVVKIRIHQVEKMAKVKLDIPTTVAGNQRMQVEVPQMTMANVHERFRWPADQVLLLSMGVVPPPTRDGGNAIAKLIPGVTNPPRADGLLMIEVKGTTIPSATPAAPGARTALQSGAFSGRY